MSSELLNVHNDLRSDAGSCWQFKSVFLSTTPFLIPKFLGKSPPRCCLWIKLSEEDGRRRETSIKELPFQNSMESCLRSQILDKRLFYFFYIFSVSQAQQKQDIPSCLCYGCACECMCLCVPRPPPPPVPLSFSSCVTVVSSRLFVWPTFSICSHHLAEGRKIPWFPLCVSVYKWWVWTLGVTPELGD